MSKGDVEPILEDHENIEETLDVKLPQKKFYRQRAHSNPIGDHIFD